MANNRSKSKTTKKGDNRARQAKETKAAVPVVPVEQQGRRLLSWTTHPALNQKGKGLILLLSSFAFLAIVAYAYGPFYVILSAVVIIGAFSSFVLPVKYVLTERGINYQNGFNRLYKKWSSFGTYQTYHDGIQLFYTQTSVRERLLRGIFIYYGDQDPARVEEIIKEGMARQD